MSKKAILVVSFGTSQKNARDSCIGAVEDAIAEHFPDWEVRRAFTSRMIIKRILKETGERIDYIDEALQRLADDGFDTVLLQPTHVIKGIEYEDVVKIANDFRSKFERIEVSEPLLSDELSYNAMLDALETEILPYIRKEVSKDCAVVLMGHGTAHFSNACYSHMYMKLFLNHTYNVFLTTVESIPGFEDLYYLMSNSRSKKVATIPFMVVAGVHAIEDMAGDEPDSLKSILTTYGYEVVPIMKGLGEFPSIRKLFIDRCGTCIRDKELA